MQSTETGKEVERLTREENLLYRRSCPYDAMCLKCRRVRKAQGRTDKEMEGAGYVCEEE